MDVFSLKGKKILVTGASSGIGREISLQCSIYGATIIALGRNKVELDKTITSLTGAGHASFIGDITNKNFLEELASKIPSLDGLVHSVGIIEYIPLKFITIDKIKRVFDVNYTMPVFLTNLLLKKKKINNNSSIVFLSSISALKAGGQAISSYAGSKAALIGTSKIMALELAKLGIRVNCLAPGMVKTEMTESIKEMLSDETLSKDEMKYPLGYGEPNDVANAALYLLSNASKWVTGTTLVLDGGLSCS